MQQEIGRYICENERGDRCTVIAYQEFIDSSTRDHPNRQMPGMKSLRLPNGDPVNRLAEDRFQIVTTGEFVRPIEVG